MSKIIAVANIKGGVGKSLIATNLACFFSRMGETMLIDCDMQETSLNFNSRRAEVEGLEQFVVHKQIDFKQLPKDLKSFSKGFEYLVIDVGGKISGLLKTALLHSDLVVIPMKMTVSDLEGTEQTLEMVEELRIGNTIDVKGLINVVKIGTKISREIEDLQKNYSEDWEIGFLPSLGDRVSFSNSNDQGIAIDELNGKERDPKAIKEMENVFKNIMEFIS